MNGGVVVFRDSVDLYRIILSKMAVARTYRLFILSAALNRITWLFSISDVWGSESLTEIEGVGGLMVLN